MLITDDKDLEELSLVAALVEKSNAAADGKEEVRSRLNELATCALAGFGFPTCRIGDGAYNRERMSTILRQSATDRDALWDSGTRVPTGNRFSHASAALTWGCLGDANVSDAAILLSDCHPKSPEWYDAFTPNGKKYEVRGKQPDSVYLCIRCDKQHISM